MRDTDGAATPPGGRIGRDGVEEASQPSTNAAISTHAAVARCCIDCGSHAFQHPGAGLPGPWEGTTRTYVFLWSHTAQHPGAGLPGPSEGTVHHQLDALLHDEIGRAQLIPDLVNLPLADLTDVAVNLGVDVDQLQAGGKVGLGGEDEFCNLGDGLVQ